MAAAPPTNRESQPSPCCDSCPRSRCGRLPRAAWRNVETNDSALLDRSLQEPGRARVIDEAIDRLERRCLALRQDDSLRHAEQVIWHQPRARYLGDERAQARTARSERIDLLAGEHAPGLRRIVGDLDQRRLLEMAPQVERDRIIAHARDLLARAVNIRDRADRRAVEHDEALLHQQISLRELNRSSARGLEGDKADIGLAA